MGRCASLAAEDNAVNQLVLRALLQQIGVTPHLVENGRDALAAWAAADWDLILMDVQMPVMDGVAAAKAIRQHEQTAGRARTPIVGLTANVMSHQVAEYLAAGMDRHVGKPIRAAELFDAIATVMSCDESGASVEASRGRRGAPQA